MEVVIKEDSTDLEKELRDSKALLEDGIDISKFLREDLSINLELLEVAISLIVDTRPNFYIYGIDEYYKIRKIEDNKTSLIEETTFIAKYIESVVEELSETGEKEIYFNG
jgi:hypothetical protein